MTAMRPVLDVIIDANIVLLLSYGLWRLAQGGVLRSGLRRDFALQLGVLRVVLLFVILSPVLSFALVEGSQWLWPRVPVTLTDVAVAAYLEGGIAMRAETFEGLLGARDRWMNMLFNGELPWLTALLALAVAGAAALMGQTVVTALRVNGIVEDAFVWRRTRRVDIRLSDTISVPFATRGLRRRHVVLPTTLITDPARLRIVLAHEFEHLRQGDVEWELVFEALRPVLYLNPAFQLWKRSFGRLRELNCDQAVLRRLNLSPRAYMECLLEFCQKRAERRPVAAFNVAFVRSGSRGARAALELRLLAMIEGAGDRSSRVVMLGLCLVLTAGVVLSAASVRHPDDWTHDRLMLSTIVNLERLEERNRGAMLTGF